MPTCLICASSSRMPRRRMRSRRASRRSAPMSASPALREVQARFVAALTGGDATNEALADLRLPTLGVDARSRLQVYRNNYRISLTDALGAVYPVLRQLVGDD